VVAPDGPLLIFAGAGSGKTRVLTHRIAYVLATRDVRANEICAVTFTNKAAREMRSRVDALLGGSTSGMWLGTFHALGARILRRDGGAIGIPTTFSIYDEADRAAALKRAMAAEGIDDKRYPVSKMGHAISAAKNELLDATTYAAKYSGEYYQAIVARAFVSYEAEMRAADALDFDDLLVRAVQLLRDCVEVRQQYQLRFRHLFVDEYQDTNRAQYVLVKLLSETHRNLTVVGDDDQCLTGHALISMADGSSKPIAAVSVGDLVLSNYGSGDVRPAAVQRVHRARHQGSGIALTMESGRRIVSTRDHTHFAGYRLGLTPQLYFTYLMHRRDVGFRLGTSQVYTKGQVKPVVGFEPRCRQEHADAVWVLSTHETENDARAAEYICSLRYQIPTLPFVARRGGSVNGLVHDPSYLKKIFDSFDTAKGARQLLSDLGPLEGYSHHRPRARTSNRRNALVALCGDRRGRTPMHRLSMVGNDEAGRIALSAAGFSVRSVRQDCESWRHETAYKDFRAVLDAASAMTVALGDEVQLHLTARLGAPADDTAHRSLPFLPAGSVQPGMVMFDATGGYDVVKTVERVELDEDVYDIDVSSTHNFIANGLVTHNSIYGWRGADVGNILSFRRDYPDATVVTLEQNYRSTQVILDAAHAVIRHNSDRAAKKLWTETSGGEPVRLISVYDEQEEALAVCGEIEMLIGREGFSLSDCAVLYRTNAQSRAFEDVLLRRGIPYRLVGGVRFYERREVKDVLAYLRLVANSRDAVSFGRVVNVPKRKIGDRTVAELERLARRRRISPFEAVRALDDSAEIAPAARAALADFGRLIDDLRDLSERMPLPQFLDRVLDATGYQRMLRDGAPENEERWANVAELVGLAAEYADVPPPQGLTQFLENVALVADVDTLDDSSNGVTLITLHQVKGLEFPVVFLAGMEEGLLPHVRALEEGDSGVAEERRLTYVGVTRAQRRLYVLHAFRRHLYGSPQLAEASRFLADLPADLLDIVRRPGAALPSPPRTPGAVRAAVHAHAVRPNPVELPPQRYREGTRIAHPKLGEGTILKSTMTRSGEEVVIKFDSAGVRIFAVSDSAIYPLID
jgi:DNA helicase II / ATP-dependent DNA helicase PcrA